ncbi:hypothetical protein LXA43DRAFT_1054070 [Ganoderma leucocontextum]|nr:hypothetical protein LXA43DRAFT_1054070 [Ganoderma leucocontextum]
MSFCLWMKPWIFYRKSTSFSVLALGRCTHTLDRATSIESRPPPLSHPSTLRTQVHDEQAGEDDGRRVQCSARERCARTIDPHRPFAVCRLPFLSPISQARHCAAAKEGPSDCRPRPDSVPPVATPWPPSLRLPSPSCLACEAASLQTVSTADVNTPCRALHPDLVCLSQTDDTLRQIAPAASRRLNTCAPPPTAFAQRACAHTGIRPRRRARSRVGSRRFKIDARIPSPMHVRPRRLFHQPPPFPDGFRLHRSGFKIPR